MPWEDNGLCPLEMFSRREHWKFKLLNFHAWGCPVYALNNTLVDGKKLPRWKPCSSQCIYVGQSITHGEAVPIALCLETGSVTVQCHVVFDDWFQTVEASANPKVNFKHNDWYKTFGLTEWQHAPSDEGLTPPTEAPPELEHQVLKQQEAMQGVQDQHNPARPLTDADLPKSESPQQRESSLQRETDPKVKPLLTIPIVETVEEDPVVAPLQGAILCALISTSEGDKTSRTMSQKDSSSSTSRGCPTKGSYTSSTKTSTKTPCANPSATYSSSFPFTDLWKPRELCKLCPAL